MQEPLPLARIHEAVLKFLRHRSDAALFGAQAVNAYVDEPRMTQDVDILSTRAEALAEELLQYLSKEFVIAVRVRSVAQGKGFRIYQLRQPSNRHLAAVRQVETLPPTQLVGDVQVPTPDELIAQKIIAFTHRQGQPKAGTDQRDLMMLLLAFPALKTATGAVANRLLACAAEPAVFEEWRKLVEMNIQTTDDAADW